MKTIKIKSLVRLALGFALGGALLAGCSLSVSDSSKDKIEYGSITINGGEESRGLSSSVLNSIAKAKVSVKGNGITTELSTIADISNGRNSGTVTISNIPTGKNRIIYVQALDSSSNPIEDVLMMSVSDIEQGNNNVTVDWTTSRKGYIYDALFENEVNVSDLTASQMEAIDSATPSVDATNINLSLFVEDFKKLQAGTITELKSSSEYIKSEEKTLVRVLVEQADSSTAEAPVFKATAMFSVGDPEDVTNDANWTSTDTTVATVNKGVVTLVGEGSTVITGSYTYGGKTKTGAVQNVTVESVGGTIDKLYLVPGTNWTQANARFAAYFYTGGSSNEWVSMTKDTASGYYVCNKPATSYVNVIFCRMNGSSTQNSWSNKWNQTGDLTIPSDKDTFKNGDSTWDDGTTEWLSTLTGTYGGGSLTSTITAGSSPDPDLPTVTIKPASGEISVNSSITVEFKENNATVTAATVSISGETTASYTLSDFTNKKLVISVSSLGITEADKAIVVNASATNSEGTTTATPVSLTTKVQTGVPDTFTWDNINCYFVLQDRFYNGDTRNDNCYGRVNSGVPQYATFHGGDIKGLTAKMDYFKKLGINAIWITAPYEQMHGWTSGAGDAFPHYAFHGYYTLDWTFMDQNMGTVAEFREFVQACHANGIRVVMDVVMNHTGYEDWQDMIDYGFGGFHDVTLDNPGKYNHACFATDGKYSKGGSRWGTNWGSDNFSKWWSSWCRGFDGKFGFAAPGGDDVTKCLDGLPDVVQEKEGLATIPTFLQTKWGKEVNNSTEKAYGNNTSHTYADYQNPSVANVDWYGKTGNWRESGKGTVVEYQVIWLSAWVRELGIDGFRCDTQKHVQEKYWKELQKACQSALEAWRTDNEKEDNSGAKDWDENFWMTGECCPRGDDNTGEPYTDGYFDSMINFRDSGTSSHTAGSMIREDEWSSYMKINNNIIDSNNNGNRNNLLTYVSSHDTNICRQGCVKLGTMLQLLPGGVQIFYGDECDRPTYEGASGDMVSRSDMNWSDGSISGDVTNGTKNDTYVAHWGKVGNFRKFNPAVGAGSGTAYMRTYTGTNAGGENKVAISISSGTVDVSGLWSDGTTVYNWYDGTHATVSGGSVTFSGGSVSQPVLVSDRNPDDYGVTF